MLILFLPPVELERPVGRVSVCPNNKLERRRAQDYIVTTLYTTLHFQGGPRVESSRRLRLERKNTLQSSPLSTFACCPDGLLSPQSLQRV